MAFYPRLWLGTIFFISLFPLVTQAEKLQITSEPAGATVEINGVVVGTTPLEKEFPGGYFHKTRTVLGSRLEHAMIARVTLAGYATKELLLSEGPSNWIGLNGRNHGEYFLLKASQFHVKLDLISQEFDGTISARIGRNTEVDFVPALSLAELVARTKPAVTYLKGLQKAGTGFLVSETGVIATNAHLARDEDPLLAILPGGVQLQAKVDYIDEDLDIALLKVKGAGFPHLTLADSSTVQQGETVFAIGNPGDAMLFSVTKGIVSGVGKFAGAGPGTWIQTDAPINPGNSGGPLLNSRGEVIGINTQKVVKRNVSGIGFALSAADLLDVLHRFYPQGDVLAEKLSSPVLPAPKSVAKQSAQEDVATVDISEPIGAEIRIDGIFRGYAPASFVLSASRHRFHVRSAKENWVQEIELLKESRITLDRPAALVPLQQ